MTSRSGFFGVPYEQSDVFKPEETQLPQTLQQLANVDQSNPVWQMLSGSINTPSTIANLEIPQLIKDADYTLTLDESGYHLYHTSASTHTWTIPANSSVPFAIGTVISFVNGPSTGNVSIAITTDTLRLAGSTDTGTRTLEANGVATVIKVASALWYISGQGLT